MIALLRILTSVSRRGVAQWAASAPAPASSLTSLVPASAGAGAASGAASGLVTCTPAL